jgi:hypothetical protein
MSEAARAISEKLQQTDKQVQDATDPCALLN